MAAYAVSSSWNNTRPVAEVVSLAASRRAIVSEPSHSWWPTVFGRIKELTALAPGWDGYAAPPVAFETANFALNMLRSICPDMEVVPSIVPGSSGDLQVEWHEVGSSVELHVRAPYDVHAYRIVHDTGATEEVELQGDFTSILGWMKGLGEPAVATITAAG